MADAVAVFSEGTFEEQIQELVNYLARGLADDNRTAYIRPFQDALLTPEGQTPLSQDAGRKKKVIGMTREKVVGLGEGSDREIEGFFNLLNSHLVALFTETSELEPHVTALVDAVLGAPETFTGIKYRVLSNLFNSLPRSSPLRQHVYRALLNMASNEGDLEVLQVNRTDVNRWLSEWNISDQDKSAFLDAVAEAFRKAGDIDTAYGYQLAYLRSVSASSPKALEASTRVISSAVSEPSIFELDSLLRVDTLQAAKDHPLFALLRVFTSGDLAQFHEWEAKHASTLSEFGK
ncbi:Eukaryotic translation initiation factor 3 subunit K, partial [Rhizoctonia solani]